MNKPHSTLKHRQKLLRYVSANNTDKVRSILQSYNFSTKVLTGGLLIALDKGFRKISDLLAEKLNYELGRTLYFLFFNFDNDSILPMKSLERIIDLAENRGATVDAQNMGKIISILSADNDEQISRFIKYLVASNTELRNLSHIVKNKMPNGYTDTAIDEMIVSKLL